VKGLMKLIQKKRLLNKLKAEHENENVYLSSIVDEAIRFYYGHVLGKVKN
jgi:hypothetical protein